MTQERRCLGCYLWEPIELSGGLVRIQDLNPIFAQASKGDKEVRLGLCHESPTSNVTTETYWCSKYKPLIPEDIK